jgi:sialate O-acetylesterase
VTFLAAFILMREFVVSSWRRFILAFFLAGSIASARAVVSLPAIFSDHAVLQKSDKVPVWGTAAPSEPVTVAIGKQKGTATAGPDGKWKVFLDLSSEGAGPFDLVVRGTNKIVITDVVIGEVWLCSGQSNMAFPLGTFKKLAAEEIPNSANPLLRHFQVKMNISPVPVDNVEGKWLLASPATSGAFSATAYYFGKSLQKQLQLPVGLINSSIGGTVIESWMSAESMSADPLLNAGKDKAVNDYRAFQDYLTHYQDWQKAHDRQDHPSPHPETFADPSIPTADWKPVTLPGLFSAAGLPDAGAIWIRKTITVPPERANHNIDLFLGNIRDTDQVYWNGKKVGESDISAVDHRYTIRFNFVPAGPVTIAVRIFNPATGAGIIPGNPHFTASGIPLGGDWLAKPELALPPLDAAALKDIPVRPVTPRDAQNVATLLFNGMINPLVPYAIRGIAWYQGESNWDQGSQYRTAFPLLIKDWRARWQRGDLPFDYCQIANYNPRTPIPGNSGDAERRDAQSSALSLPQTGQAVLIDIGEEANIHPWNKKETGERLARIPLAQTYGKDLIYSGPSYDSMTLEADKVRIHFKHADGGLVAKPLPSTYQPSSAEPKTVPLVRNSPASDLEGFAICGADRQWKWADAKIDGGTVIVSSPAVPKPVAVRYAWADNPICNLYNGGDLPACPFRTDDFPLISAKAHY